MTEAERLTTVEQAQTAILNAQETMLGMLAESEKRSTEFVAANERLVTHCALLEARLWALEVASGLRVSGRFDLEGLRFSGNATKASMEGVRARAAKALRGEAA